MNFAHLHLLLNHFPEIGTLLGFGLLLVSFFGKNRDLRRSALIVFAAIALLTIPTFISGVGAQSALKDNPAAPQALIDRHEGSAMLAFWFMEITGTLALIGLWQAYQKSGQAAWNVAAVFVFSLLTVILMGRVSDTGINIRHPELQVAAGATLQAGQPVTVTDGIVGSIIHPFEPSPDKFSKLVVGNKWWWAFMMDLHFIGLALLVGTIGILDLRIMGFLKQLPIGPLHRLVPWAMAGLGINVLTGMLAFIGMPTYYTYDAAFWLKMLTLMLLGANAAAFYLTGIFNEVEPLGAGEDAPISAKLIAASSLVLWFVVIILGRYIQLLESSIPNGN